MVRHPCRVGSHVSDETDRSLIAQLDTFIEPLRDSHRARRLEVELARCFLLEARGDEGGCRAAAHFLALDGTNDERRLFDRADNLAGLRLRQLVGLVVDALVFPAEQTRLEGRRIGRLQTCIERPVLFGAECFTFALALDDYPERDRLHPPRAESSFHLVPEQRAYLVADQPVEDATGLLGVVQMAVQLARMFDRFLDRIRGYFVKQDSMDLGSVGLPEALGQVPGYRLTFAVGVGGQVDVLLALGCLLDPLDNLCFARNNAVLRLKILLDVDTKLALGQVNDMPHRRRHFVRGTEITLDGFGFSGRFDYDEVLCHRGDFLSTHPFWCRWPCID